VVTGALAISGAIAGGALPASAVGAYSVTGTLTGVPTEGAPAVPLAGVYVLSASFDQYGNPVYLDGVNTDENGVYTIEFPDAGEYSLLFNCSQSGHPACDFDYPAEYLGESSDSQHAAKFTVGEEDPISVQNYTLYGVSTITGTITKADGEPASGAYVNANRPGQFNGSTATADANGVYTLTRVPAGDLVVQASFYETAPAQDRRFWADTYYGGTTAIADAEPVPTVAGSATDEIDIAVTLQPSVKIHVVDESGAPISGVYFVRFKLDEETGEFLPPNSGESLGTNADGWYGTTVAPGESYKFFIVDEKNPSVDDYSTPQTRTETYESEWHDDATTINGAYVYAVAADSSEQKVLEIELAEHTGAPTYLGDLRILPSETSPGTLYANSGVAFSPYGIDLQHQWYRDGVAIAGATGRAYEPTTDDAGIELTVKVTATTAETLEEQTPANTTVATSAIYDVQGTAFTTAPVPTIALSPVVGRQITAALGTWSPRTVPSNSYTYAWFRDGDLIDGATSATFTPTAGDLGAKLTVAVTARRPGFSKTTRVSLPTKTVVDVIAAGTPTVTSGTARFDKPVTVSYGTWGPDAEALTFTQQWFRENNEGRLAISGATDATYTPGIDDIGTSLSVNVTGTRAEYGDNKMVRVDAPGIVYPALLVETTPAAVSGDGIVGQPFTATPGVYVPDTAVLAYSWLRNDVVIDNATGLSYTPITADVGKKITFRTRVTQSGYAATNFDVVASNGVAALGTFVAPTPTITGTTKVGSTLTAVKGAWNPTDDATFVYQWRSGGGVIAGATGATYTLQPSDLGDQISVRVTGSKTNYVTRTSAYSVPTVKVSAGTLAAKTPTISGSAKVGKALTAVTGAWAPTPVTFSYKWLRDGKTISGATKSAYTLTASDLKKAISVTVTGSKSGYTSAAKTSAKTAKAGTGALVAPKPVIKGTAKVGSKLTATTSGWGPGSVSKKYQWYNNGKKIKKATKSTYKLPSSAKGDKITVKVTGKKTGFATKTVASSAVKVAKK
jgi:hypothetical protein